MTTTTTLDLDGSRYEISIDPNDSALTLRNEDGGEVTMPWHVVASFVDNARDRARRAAAARQVIWEGDDVRLVANDDGGASFQTVDCGDVRAEVWLTAAERVEAAAALASMTAVER